MKILRTNLDAALEETENNFDITFRPGYTGRYNRTAEIAVVGEQEALEEFELYLAALMVTNNLDFEEVEPRQLLNSIIDVRGYRESDNMGLDLIYYYPHITLEENR